MIERVDLLALHREGLVTQQVEWEYLHLTTSSYQRTGPARTPVSCGQGVPIEHVANIGEHAYEILERSNLPPGPLKGVVAVDEPITCESTTIFARATSSSASGSHDSHSDAAALLVRA